MKSTDSTLIFDFPRLLLLQESIGGCFNSGLSSDSLVNLLQMKIEVDEALKNRNDITSQLMKSNGISSPTLMIDGTSKWVYNHLPNHEQIAEAMDKINRKRYDIKPVKFMSKDEFNVFTARDNNRQNRPLNIDQIAFLSKYLLKK